MCVSDPGHTAPREVVPDVYRLFCAAELRNVLICSRRSAPYRRLLDYTTAIQARYLTTVHLTYKYWIGSGPEFPSTPPSP